MVFFPESPMTMPMPIGICAYIGMGIGAIGIGGKH